MAMKPRPRRGRSDAQRGWSVPRHSPTTDPRHRRPRVAGPTPPIESRSERKADPGAGQGPEFTTTGLEAILDDFTLSWERGERPRAEGYLGLLAPEESAELIYHEFCLAEASDLDPDPAQYLARFPEQAQALGRLFSLHGVFSSTMLRDWLRPLDLPSSGDDIGPYRLLRELGRGAFARVFLAEQSDLDHRLVVLKVSTRATAEPQLLARARHAHIVEVLRHAVAEDGALHLVCMPFLGGATLAAVLEERRRRKRRPRSGLDLLGDLDRVSAPEYPSTELARPAREILGRLSHPQALAWIVARLAEALDHAHRRGVTHGDLKPSNVLLTAEGNPLLLDFNLSVDSRDADPGDPDELGGTLAYMAPERLEAIAASSPEANRKPADLHRADLYALGLLLLEALTGRPIEVPARRQGSPRDLAVELVKLRRSRPPSLDSGNARSIPPALRSILARCLAPDPLDRYSRGNELAEDLDRWRSDRPLTFAEEPRRSGLTREIRRRRASLITFGLTMTSAIIVTGLASVWLQGTRRDQALARYSMIIDRGDSGIFGFRNGLWRADELGEPVELASRHLSRYDVLNDPDWRARDDIRSLPERERDELEVWLFEQILRYASALGEIPNSPESWQRGLALLDRTLRQVQSEPLQAQRRLLLERLGLPDRGTGTLQGPPLPGWMDAYLVGVAAEPLHAREAMGRFLDVLKDRPNLFWAHYRTAVVACRLNEYDLAARHLRICCARCPSNPAPHAQLASVLYRAARDMAEEFQHDPYAEALMECDRALAIDPDFADAYRVRAMIHRVSHHQESVEADIERFASLSRKAGPAAAMDLRLRLMFTSSSNIHRLSDAGISLARRILELKPDDRGTRMNLAKGLVRSQRTLEAIAEYDQIIEGEPNQLEARYMRAEQLLMIDRPAAIEEFARLIEHPRIEELFSELPHAIMAYCYYASALIESGKIAEALEVAEKARLQVKRSRALANKTIIAREKLIPQSPSAPNARTLFLLARVHAAASKTQSMTLDLRQEHQAKMFECLGQLLAFNRLIHQGWVAKDPLFDGYRSEIDRKFETIVVDR